MAPLELKLSTGTVIKYADQEMINERLKQAGLEKDIALKDTDRSDLTTHVYEGGFKVWECSIDLCEFLEKKPAEWFAGKKVLELGCGAALPSALCLMRGASVVGQDFNACVVEGLTSESYALNCEGGQHTVVAGAWDDGELKKHIEKEGFDVILSSETIYNEADYASLLDIIEYALKPHGQVIMAAKVYYFGVGGNVVSWKEFVQKRGLMNSTDLEVIKESVPRIIWEHKRKQ